MTSFEDLEVYRLSEDLADTLWRATSAWPPFARDTLGKQIVRAADSVGANIAEGAGRSTRADNSRFLSYARGSLYEVKHGVRRAGSRRLLSEHDLVAIDGMLDELLPRLAAFQRYVAARR